MKKTLVALMLALGAARALAAAEPFPVQNIQFPLAIEFDIDTAGSYEYPFSQGFINTAFGNSEYNEGVLNWPGLRSDISISTSGSSTTIAATTASTGPFLAVQVDDFLFIQTPLTATTRVSPRQLTAIGALEGVWLKVTARASADSITVNQAVDLTGGVTGWYWRRAGTKQQAGWGWVPVRGFDVAKFDAFIDQQVTTTGIDFQVQCRVDRSGKATGTEMVVYPFDGATCGWGTLATDTCTFTGATVTTGRFSVEVPARGWHECRLGLKITSTDDGDDLTTNAEIVTVWFTGLSGVTPVPMR